MLGLSIALTVLLLLETLPSAAAGLTRYRSGLARLDQLTRLSVTQGRNLWAAAGLVAPGAGVAGGALEAAAFGWVLMRQWRCGDRGRSLAAYSLFATVALAVLVVNALR
jgi:hypothetical protein